MFDKWKYIKTAGAVVILAAVVIFLCINVRIKSPDSYVAEKLTDIEAENITELTSAETEDRGKETEKTTDKESEKPADKESEKPADKESERATESKGQNRTIQVSIEIRCDSAVKVKDTVQNPGVKEKIPDSGEILKETVYRVPEGTNVYDLLSQAAALNGIDIKANTDKTYVMSINNLDQMMLTQQSGWKYSVNGKVPGMAALRYILQDGDKVKWFYVLSATEE